jgi:hypothetical protein
VKDSEKEMDYANSDKLIFILASPGGSGHRLGRIVSCFDNVYWYNNKTHNGITPWDVFHTNLVKGKTISPHHFDRRTTKNMIPLMGERIEKFWADEFVHILYETRWPDAMAAAGADEILNEGKHLVWVLHDIGDYLLTHFPNAKIINLIDQNVEYIVDRYINTTALFPINIENKSLKPIAGKESKFALSLAKLLDINPIPTHRDYWAWSTHGDTVYSSVYDSEYYDYVATILTTQHIERIKKNPKYINVTWDNLDLELIKSFIGATSIDLNYKNLMK